MINGLETTFIIIKLWSSKIKVDFAEYMTDMDCFKIEPLNNTREVLK